MTFFTGEDSNRVLASLTSVVRNNCHTATVLGEEICVYCVYLCACVCVSVAEFAVASRIVVIVEVTVVHVDVVLATLPCEILLLVFEY